MVRQVFQKLGVSLMVGVVFLFLFVAAVGILCWVAVEMLIFYSWRLLFGPRSKEEPAETRRSWLDVRRYLQADLTASESTPRLSKLP